MPITLKEAEDVVNPSLEGPERERAISAVISGVAANDAYLNSRPEIEQAFALAKGGQTATSFADRQDDKSSTQVAAKPETTALEVEKEAVADAEVVEKEAEKVAESFPGELVVIEKRAKELGLMK